MAAVERAGAPADERIDAGGRCVIPGFVDSHTHLVFAGDRGDEFAARMAGAPYAAGGIRVTTDATRAATRRRAARARARRAGDEALPRRHHAPRDQVRLRARRRRPSSGCCAVAGRAHRRRHVPRRARRARRVRGPRRRLRRARLRRDARGLRAARALDRRLLRGAARSTPTSRAPCSRPAAPPASACACTATSSARARACSSRSSSARPRSTTAPTSTDDDIDALAGSDTVATFLPATDFSTRQPYPDARRVDRRRRRRSRSRRTATRARATRPRWRSASRSRCATCA